MQLALELAATDPGLILQPRPDQVIEESDQLIGMPDQLIQVSDQLGAGSLQL
jgi:hypothetical protein